MEMTKTERAVVLLSGGLDSATVLAQAYENGDTCFALTVDYGQRHRAEIAAAEKIAQLYGAAEHRVVKVDYGQFGGSALTDASIAIPVDEPSTTSIPVTYVPARNTVMLAIALGWAEVVDARRIYIGVNAIDYSGYPDCRPEFIAAFAELAKLATKRGVEGDALEIKAPLINFTKAEIVRLGSQLHVDYSLTVSCYQADEQGRACGRCDACRLRRDGFSVAGLDDPTRYTDRLTAAGGDRVPPEDSG
ncbi:MAG: 7-cyano-7-deazaguanine synthase [Gammaproteobacteria bacterium]|jgi:7-cyano-7-deazaguanine synthase